MMTAENNRKYIAEAWIGNKEEEEFKKSYLNSLIRQWQGHLNGFDADTVDGFHKEDILKAIDDETKELLKSFYIGKTFFSKSNETIQYFLGFEGIKLYNIQAEDTEDEDKQLPWSNIIYDDEEGREIPNLLDVIRQLYNLTYFGEQYSGITNKEIYETFIERLDSIESSVLAVEGVLAGKIDIDGKLNADYVNGLRFFIYTPEQYQDLKDKAKIYDDGEEEDYESYEGYSKKLHSINNIFIIKSRQEIIDGGYEDGVYPYNPDNAIIYKDYVFRVDNAVDEGHEGKYLQYSHEDSSVWHDMCPVTDFFDVEFFTNQIINILDNESNYTLNPDAVKEALTHVEVSNDTVDIPLLNYARDNFVAGGIYDYVTDDDKITLPNNKIGQFTYLDLTSLVNDLKEDTQEVQNNLNEYKEEISGETGELTGIKGDVRTINDNISDIRGGSTKSIQDCWNKLDAIQTKLNKMVDETFPEYKRLHKWENLYTTQEWINSSATKSMNLTMWVNKGLGLAYVKINGYH